MRGAVSSTLFLFFTSLACAQVPTGNIEIGGFVGATYGISAYGVMGGGNVSYSINKHILPYVEYSYFPNLEREVGGRVGNVPTGDPYFADYKVAGNDFHGGLHYRFPIKESRIVPYAVFGVGRMGYSSGKVNLQYRSFGTLHDACPPSNEFCFSSPGGGNVAINFGGGLRFYTHPRFGFRIEAKGYKPYGEPASNFAGATPGYSSPFLKVEGGVFFMIH
jgi:hypothetical protein